MWSEVTQSIQHWFKSRPWLSSPKVASGVDRRCERMHQRTDDPTKGTVMPANDRANTFRRLHESGLLILANVWDAGSARLVEHLGAPALATTSAAVAWSHGYADGDLLPVRLLAATVADITRVVRVPL